QHPAHRAGQGHGHPGAVHLGERGFDGGHRGHRLGVARQPESGERVLESGGDGGGHRGGGRGGGPLAGPGGHRSPLVLTSSTCAANRRLRRPGRTRSTRSPSTTAHTGSSTGWRSGTMSPTRRSTISAE